MINYKKLQTSQSNQSGFTIIESLVAVIVVAILMTAISPVIVLSVGTRVQSRRIELATDAATAYIDAIKSKKIEAPSSPITGAGQNIKDYDPPSVGTLTCNKPSDYCTRPATNLYCVDGDGDGGGCSKTSSKDFVIQAFRYNKASSNDEDGYQLGLRVYRADGFASNGGDLKQAPTKQNTFTGGIGNRKTPLFEITTEISDENTSFGDLCNRLQPQNPSDNLESEC